MTPDITIDLHTHTNASDGLDTPAELVHNAAQRGISVLGLTDHDTVAGLEAAAEAAARVGITLVPGVDRAEVHILGYFVDRTDDDFRHRMEDLARGRVRRVEQIIARLQELGYPIDGDAILSQAEEGSIGRPHVARALMEIGAVDSVNDAFERFLKSGRPGYVPRDPFEPEDAVRLLIEHGAIPVLAHPFTTKDIEGILKRLVPAGLLGFETYYAEYSPEQHAELRAIADAWNLAPTGGSDYHGAGFREGRDLGTAPVPGEVWERLSALHRSRDGRS
jgi:predicted metal-dependent phosphoesterase TrpH